MPEPSTNHEFLDLVRKSGVLDDKRLDAYVDKLRSASVLPADPGKLAGLMVRDGVLTHFQAEQFLLGKWRRFQIGKYKVLERLGAGGMGSVYLCEHKFMRRRTAVKVLPAAKAEDPASLERFYREARAVAALDHPNIVRAYDIDQDDNLHFLVMEYVDGSSLLDIVKKFGPMDIDRAAHYIRQAAVGLQHAHQAAGLIHRDIKPANILVERQGGVKVLDMGLARFFHDEEDLLTEKYDESVLGTADYLSPEQALDSHNVDIRTDIYSLGATFYFLLTGATPFGEGTVAQKLIWHQIRQPRPIRELRPEIPPALVAVLEKMMAKDPAQRYPNPAEVMAALDPWTQKPIPPPPIREMPRLCPALTGLPGSSGDLPALSAAPTVVGRTTAAAPRVGPSEPTPPPPLGPAPSAANPVLTTRPTPPPGDAGRTQVLAHPAPSPIPRKEGLWNTLSRGEDATLPQSREPPPFRKGPAPRPFYRQRPILLALAALVVLAALAAWVVFSGFVDKTPTTIPGLPTPVTWNVTHAGTEGSFKTVREALGKANPGDRILVLDDTLEETLILEDGRLGKGVTIEAGVVGKRVLWTCPAGSPDGRFVSLANVPGLRLKGFTLDGQNRVAELVRVSGKCPGLLLENIQLQGFTRTGVALWGCNGQKDWPVTFRGLRVLSGKPEDKAPASALSFDLDPRDAVSNRYLDVTDSRFEGPFQTAVHLAGPTEDVRITHTRFFQVTDGFVYDKASPRYRLTLTVEGNTFAEVKGAALHFLGMPIPDWKSEVVVKNNLFARTGTLMQVDEPPDDKARDIVFHQRGGNVRDPASKEGNLPLQDQVLDFNLPADPNDPQFLLYPPTSPLNSAGHDQTPVGVPPPSSSNKQ